MMNENQCWICLSHNLEDVPLFHIYQNTYNIADIIFILTSVQVRSL